MATTRANMKVSIGIGDKTIETTTEDIDRAAAILKAGDAPFGDNAQQQLRSLVARIERLNGDRAAVMVDIKEVYTEAKGSGFDTKVLRKVIAQRAKNRAKVDEEAALIDLYLSAIGWGEL